MMSKPLTITVLLTVLIISCEKSLEPIKYGEEDCSWCRMKIMDPRFGSEAITLKGRIYKFDSGECLIHYLDEAQDEFKYLAVTDFTSPNTLIQAENAWFLISEKMPSPMGAYLNAFASKEQAQNMQQKMGGEVYDWSGIKSRFRNKE